MKVALTKWQISVDQIEEEDKTQTWNWLNDIWEKLTFPFSVLNSTSFQSSIYSRLTNCVGGTVSAPCFSSFRAQRVFQLVLSASLLPCLLPCCRWVAASLQDFGVFSPQVLLSRTGVCSIGQAGQQSKSFSEGSSFSAKSIRVHSLTIFTWALQDTKQ